MRFANLTLICWTPEARLLSTRISPSFLAERRNKSPEICWRRLDRLERKPPQAKQFILSANIEMIKAES